MKAVISSALFIVPRLSDLRAEVGASGNFEILASIFYIRTSP
jgi:hypothetical protein